jgi:hypothetical protein
METIDWPSHDCTLQFVFKKAPPWRGHLWTGTGRGALKLSLQKKHSKIERAGLTSGTAVIVARGLLD